MNLYYLETFRQVAKSLNFSKAADHLEVSKGLVSRHIKTLELDLQCTLFHRTTRSVRLTEAGQELYAAAKEIENVAQQTSLNIKNLSQKNHGYIRFTLPTSLGPNVCKEILPRFINKNRSVKIELDFTTQLKDIEFGEFDVALRTQKILPDNIIARNLGEMKNILLSSPEWLRNNPIDCPQQLNQVECLQNSYKPDWNQWNLQSTSGEKLSLKVTGNLSCNSYDGIRSLAEAGMGVANLPMPIVESLITEGKLIQVLPNWFSCQHDFSLLYAKQPFYPHKLKSFIDLLLKWREAHPNWFI